MLASKNQSEPTSLCSGRRAAAAFALALAWTVGISFLGSSDAWSQQPTRVVAQSEFSTLPDKGGRLYFSTGRTMTFEKADVGTSKLQAIEVTDISALSPLPKEMVGAVIMRLDELYFMDARDILHYIRSRPPGSSLAIYYQSAGKGRKVDVVVAPVLDAKTAAEKLLKLQEIAIMSQICILKFPTAKRCIDEEQSAIKNATELANYILSSPGPEFRQEDATAKSALADIKKWVAEGESRSRK